MPPVAKAVCQAKQQGKCEQATEDIGGTLAGFRKYRSGVDDLLPCRSDLNVGNDISLVDFSHQRRKNRDREQNATGAAGHRETLREGRSQMRRACTSLLAAKSIWVVARNNSA